MKFTSILSLSTEIVALGFLDQYDRMTVRIVTEKDRVDWFEITIDDKRFVRFRFRMDVPMEDIMKSLEMFAESLGFDKKRVDTLWFYPDFYCGYELPIKVVERKEDYYIVEAYDGKDLMMRWRVKK